MKNGPGLCEVYDCIKGDPGQSMWDDHIRRIDYDVVLTKEPGDSELSDYDVEVLTGLAKKHRDDDWGTMIDIVHQLREWRDPAKLNKKTVPLPASEILRADGADEETIAKVAKEANYHAAVGRLLRNCA
jgi:hypothetical protein